MAIRLVTSQEIIEHTSMGGNVDTDHYVHFIDDVQVMYIENVLGTKLYDKILTDFDASTITGDYLEMLDEYIKPIIWHLVYAEYLRAGNVIAGNAGIFEHTPEGGQTADLDNIIYRVKAAKSIADAYTDRLKRYLCDKNISEYDNAQDNDYDQDPKNINTIGGWYI